MSTTRIQVSLLAQDVERFNEGRRTFQCGLMLFAFMLWGLGGFLLVQKMKPNQPILLQRILGVILCVGGITLAFYAWFGFKPI
jgi:hypothetical protein